MAASLAVASSTVKAPVESRLIPGLNLALASLSVVTSVAEDLLSAAYLKGPLLNVQAIPVEGANKVLLAIALLVVVVLIRVANGGDVVHCRYDHAVSVAASNLAVPLALNAVLQSIFV